MMEDVFSFSGLFLLSGIILPTVIFMTKSEIMTAKKILTTMSNLLSDSWRIFFCHILYLHSRARHILRLLRSCEPTLAHISEADAITKKQFCQNTVKSHHLRNTKRCKEARINEYAIHNQSPCTKSAKRCSPPCEVPKVVDA